MISVRGLHVVGRRGDGGEVPIVRDVSLEARRGEVLALVGESGSGKTTIALALMGYARAGCRISGGAIAVAGHRVDQMDAGELRSFRGRTISYVAQNAGSAFNPALTLHQQVIEPALAHWVLPRRDAERRAIELFRAMALPHPETIGARYPHQLSGGQLQRLMAAMALITEPEVVVFDEPTTALDVTTQIEVLEAFRTVLVHRGITGIYVTHDLAVVAQVADRAVVLRHGAVCESGDTPEVLARPRTPYTRELVAACHLPVRPKGLDPAVDAASGTAPEPVLTLSDIVVGYGRVDANGLPAHRILDGIDLSVTRGRTLGIIGESGCGKSTLARASAGLQPPAAGTVRFRGETLAGRVARRTPEQRRRVQIVAQNADLVLNPAWTVGAILERVLRFFHNLRGAVARAEALRLLDIVQLPHAVFDRRPPELSGGQKQRVNFARALAARPELVLCDEITAALDPVVAAAILTLMSDLQETLGLSCIFITHDLHALRAVCDRVAVLLGGHVVEQCDAAALMRGAHHPYTRLLVSSVPEMRPGWLDEVVAQRSAAAAPFVPTAVGEGCPFVSRCVTRIAGVCERVRPPVVATADGGRIACHLPPGDLPVLAPGNSTIDA
ncbi:ABC transporter oligopeptide permease OppD [Acidomonas methanolica NBRC 104435]|uniref:ABC transporter oligopeptide permease OppD n=4 Tax=Acidomonas methanolica TaxID=437 RepID=A0A023D0K6_ACIMT|nr:ABC transporter oligopeptide permease OppD [Acidomonas methanolica NBRC 104435]GEK98808.1 peptide ABC transporter ATP-binding protein [Acidomonas methanolica NBRC 104435]